MSAPKQMHVAANLPQDFTEEEKAQARENIGAAPLYTAGYGIAIDGQTISKTHHKLMATNNISYQYCKVFDFTWQNVYGRGQCVFTATHYGGDYVTFAVSATRALGANYTVGWPYVVSASPDMVNSYAFVERLEIREVGSRLIGYLKLRNFSQNQFWLDWEGSSNSGILSFTPELTNSPEGDIAWTCTVDSHNVPYTQNDVNTDFQKKLTEGDHIHIDSDNVISADGVLIAKYNVTTFNAIKDAISHGNYVVAKSGTMYYGLQHDFDDRVVFMGKNNLMHSEASFVQVDSDNIWSTVNSSPAITTFAQHGSTTPSDDWNSVDQTNSFALAQKGTHGGTMQVGLKVTANGWSGTYKIFTRLYHDSTQTSAPASGTTEFMTATITGTEFTEVGLVPQYMLQSGTQWTYIVEACYAANPGRSIRLTLSGIGSSDITFLGEEIR